MRFRDLTKDQRTEAKQRLLCDRLDKDGKTPSYGELAEVDETITDDEAEKAYAGTEFVADDFSCGDAADRDGVLDELKEWAERTLRTCVFAHDHPLSSGVNVFTITGIEWARKALLDHIEAIRP